MGINLKKIFGAVTDFVPLGGVAKSLVEGAGALLFKKAAKVVGVNEGTVDKIFAEADKMAEYDQEIKLALIEEEKERRAHELAFFGRFKDLDVKTRKLRSRMRPYITIGVIGSYLLGIIVNLIQQVIPASVFGAEFAYVHPESLVEITKWVTAFWFTGRTVEKIADIVKS